ncbi:MAG: HAD family hydrolase [Bacillota bacterium]|nr:HAD family hydrolase [Bacillota bacterium]
MGNYKLLFLDIDGTILRPDNSIEESTKDAVSQLQDNGMEIFLATGRPLHEIKELAKELKINSFIGYNGAYGIYHGEDLFQEPMKAETVEHFLKIVNLYEHEVVLYTNKSNSWTSIDSAISKDFMKSFHLHQNEPFSFDILNEVLGITILNIKGKERASYDFDKSIHLSQVNVEKYFHCYDVIRDNVNKGFGVKRVLEYLGIPKESSIAFGDGMNDKEMLLNVGEGFAMGNAHPDLFAYAKHRTTDVNHSGIYVGLQKLGLVK